MLMLLLPLLKELLWADAAQRPVWPDGVVFGQPLLGDDPRFGQ